MIKGHRHVSASRSDPGKPPERGYWGIFGPNGIVPLSRTLPEIWARQNCDDDNCEGEPDGSRRYDEDDNVIPGSNAVIPGTNHYAALRAIRSVLVATPNRPNLGSYRSLQQYTHRANEFRGAIETHIRERGGGLVSGAGTWMMEGDRNLAEHEDSRYLGERQ